MPNLNRITLAMKKGEIVFSQKKLPFPLKKTQKIFIRIKKAVPLYNIKLKFHLL